MDIKIVTKIIELVKSKRYRSSNLVALFHPSFFCYRRLNWESINQRDWGPFGRGKESTKEGDGFLQGRC